MQKKKTKSKERKKSRIKTVKGKARNKREFKGGIVCYFN
jgi:hypothetical protein